MICSRTQLEFKPTSVRSNSAKLAFKPLQLLGNPICRRKPWREFDLSLVPSKLLFGWGLVREEGEQQPGYWLTARFEFLLGHRFAWGILHHPRHTQVTQPQVH